MEFLEWFTGGSQYHYHNLFHCMGKDTMWAWFLIIVKSAIIVPYLIIARIWWQQSKEAKGHNSASALRSLMGLFLFCAVCGYAIPIISSFWPAKRLEALFHIPLLISAWIFVLRTSYIKIWYTDRNRVDELRQRLQKAEWERDQLLILVQDQEKTVRESSRALALISKAKKDLRSGVYDDAI